MSQVEHSAVQFLVDQALRSVEQDEERILHSLGHGYMYEYAPPNVRYSAPYLELGQKLWSAIQYELHEVLCHDGEPKGWIAVLAEGDERDLVVGLLAAITSVFDVSLGIAMPIVALIVKRKLQPFCEATVEKPPQSFREILAERRERMLSRQK